MKLAARAAVCAVVALVGTPAALAEEPTVGRGTTGLSAVPFQAANRTGEPIQCDVATAHWYSTVIGHADPGSAVSGELWSDPATGVLYVLNAESDQMPVQEAWCGFAGQSVSTRADIRFTRRIGVVEPAVTLNCTGRTAEGKLDCRRDGAR